MEEYKWNRSPNDADLQNVASKRFSETNQLWSGESDSDSKSEYNNDCQDPIKLAKQIVKDRSLSISSRVKQNKYLPNKGISNVKSSFTSIYSSPLASYVWSGDLEAKRDKSTQWNSSIKSSVSSTSSIISSPPFNRKLQIQYPNEKKTTKMRKTEPVYIVGSKFKQSNLMSSNFTLKCKVKRTLSSYDFKSKKNLNKFNSMVNKTSKTHKVVNTSHEPSKNLEIDFDIQYNCGADNFRRGKQFFARYFMKGNTSSALTEDDDDDITYNRSMFSTYLEMRQQVSSKMNAFSLTKSKLLPKKSFISKNNSWASLSTGLAWSKLKRSSNSSTIIKRRRSTSTKRGKRGAGHTYSDLSIDSQKTIYLSQLLMFNKSLPLSLQQTSSKSFEHSTYSSTPKEGAKEPVTPEEILARGYLFHREIGNGSSSLIYETIRIKNPELRLACKHIRYSVLIKEKDYLKDFIDEEIKILKQVNHQSIIQLYEIFSTPNDVYIFMYLAKNGTIFDYLYKFWLKPLPETYAKKWTKQLTSALSYLHNLKIVHRDIKLENFLLDDKYCALLSDFGMSVSMNSKNSTDMLAIQCGTLDYMAPEIHMASKCSNSYYDPYPSDIYSMGVCLFEMVNYFRPFAMSVSETHRSMVFRKKNRKYTFNKRIYLTKECHELLHQMLQPTPLLRPTADQILLHIWFLQSVR